MPILSHGHNRLVRRLPEDDDACGWIASLPPPAPPRRLAGAERADCAVVGAGFTGLAAARRLAELRPEWRVVVLEAQRAGFGASGRSSGFVVDLVHFVARMRPEDGKRYLRLARHGISRLRRLVAEHSIACDWDETGWMHVAAGEPAERSLGMLRAWLRDRGDAFQWLDRDGLEQVTGSRYYRAGIRLPGSVLVQSAALVRGLAATLPPGVVLYEESPVTAIGRSGRFELTTGQGRVTADRLILAANGCTPSLGFLADRLFPLFTFGSLTRPLGAGEQAALGGEREWGLLAEDAMGSSVRRTRDQRILIRNSVHYGRRLGVDAALRGEIANLHRRAFRARFPMLPEVELEHTWAGLMGATPGREHFFGRLDEGLYAAAGYSGAGIAMGTAAGELLADLATGEASERLDDMLALPAPRRIPPEPFLSLGIRWRVARMTADASESF